ncbi:MAG: hypothetical protein ACI9ES_002997, partial [Oceanospirillaceae bacterium]
MICYFESLLAVSVQLFIIVKEHRLSILLDINLSDYLRT